MKSDKVAESRVPDELLAEIMKQLLASDRFMQFYEVNYDMKKEVDDEAKTVTYMLIEVPYSVARERIEKRTALIPKENMVDLLNEPGKITLATEIPKDLKKN